MSLSFRSVAHREVHRCGDETEWWQHRGIDALKERAARSRGGETRGQPTEPEAFRQACITRGRSTVRRGYSLARTLQLRHNDRSCGFRDGAVSLSWHGASVRPFLNVGTEDHWGHVNFRGQVLWEAETFSDDRVLLHIPPGFDPKRPAVMVAFFHGHGANLAQDVFDRQRVPEQITAAAVNAVLVAPQFAVNAADSIAGKFWEPNGFRRFLDEAAVKLARMYGDQRTAFTFARMPIVIVAYSGGFGPTLSVLERGGVRSRVRGLVLLDALYGGTGKFADWIAENRSTFFVSSYTPHTAPRNVFLERLLRKRAVPYSSELRNTHLQGMVTFLPAGDISHRDFVTHAWADNPIKDILLRMDDSDLRIETASVMESNSPRAFVSGRN
jgi:hypothetical protein